MTLLKWVLFIIYAIVDAIFIYDYATEENEKNKKRRFNLYLGNRNNDILHRSYVN